MVVVVEAAVVVVPLPPAWARSRRGPLAKWAVNKKGVVVGGVAAADGDDGAELDIDWRG